MCERVNDIALPSARTWLVPICPSPTCRPMRGSSSCVVSGCLSTLFVRLRCGGLKRRNGRARQRGRQERERGVARWSLYCLTYYWTTRHKQKLDSAARSFKQHSTVTHYRDTATAPNFPRLRFESLSHSSHRNEVLSNKMNKNASHARTFFLLAPVTSKCILPGHTQNWLRLQLHANPIHFNQISLFSFIRRWNVALRRCRPVAIRLTTRHSCVIV